MSKRVVWMTTVLVLLVAVVATAEAFARRLHFVSIEGLVEQEVGRIVLPEIYRQLGMDIVITDLPAKRAESLAVSGERDGEIMRIWSYGEQNRDVVRVPTPYYALETTVFVLKGSAVMVNSREDLKKYRIAKVRGVKHTNDITSDVDLSQLRNMNDTTSAMRMLQLGRVDLVLTNRNDGLHVVENLGLLNVVSLPESLAVLPLYHYVHKSQAKLVEPVDAVIRSMKESGELDTLIQAAETEVLLRHSH